MLFDMSYLSIDSVQEGVGSSQIKAMLFRIAQSDLRIKLITFEKEAPKEALSGEFKRCGIDWTPLPFQTSGVFGGLARVSSLIRAIPDSRVLHCRSDLPSFSGLLSKKAPVLWDVRSLWREQRKLMNPLQVNPLVDFSLFQIEKYVASNSLALNTLTKAVVPILKDRHKEIPELQTVIPTCVDIDRFRFSHFPKGRIRMLISGNLNGNYDVRKLNQLTLAIKNLVELEVIWATDVSIKGIKPIHDFKISVDHADMPSLISSCHFGVAILQESSGNSLAAAMPTKVAEFLSCGRPVVVSSQVGDFDEIFSARNAGLTMSQNEDVKSIAEELIELVSNQTTTYESRRIAEDYFDLDAGAAEYLKVYSRLSEAHN